jgi:hypothetical protein
MTRVIRIKYAESEFLAETDKQVKIPQLAGIEVQPKRPEEELKQVVSLGEVVRDFSEVSNLIVTCCTGLFDAINKIPKPEKVAVEFGIKLGGEAGVPLLTKASGEANFKITVEWRK